MRSGETKRPIALEVPTNENVDSIMIMSFLEAVGREFGTDRNLVPLEVISVIPRPGLIAAVCDGKEESFLTSSNSALLKQLDLRWCYCNIHQEGCNGSCALVMVGVFPGPSKLQFDGTKEGQTKLNFAASFQIGTIDQADTSEIDAALFEFASRCICTGVELL